MKKVIATITLFLVTLFAYSQYFSGYYVSAPKVHSFDHFKIKQSKDGATKLDGALDIHAYCSKKDELWEMVGEYVSDNERRSFLIKEYGQDKDIISVHTLKFLWDGNEWEYFLLGYLGQDKHRHFIVVEEIFNDETETELLAFSTFDWVKAHHISDGSK